MPDHAFFVASSGMSFPWTQPPLIEPMDDENQRKATPKVANHHHPVCSFTCEHPQPLWERLSANDPPAYKTQVLSERIFRRSRRSAMHQCRHGQNHVSLTTSSEQSKCADGPGASRRDSAGDFPCHSQLICYCEQFIAPETPRTQYASSASHTLDVARWNKGTTTSRRDNAAIYRVPDL